MRYLEKLHDFGITRKLLKRVPAEVDMHQGFAAIILMFTGRQLCLVISAKTPACAAIILKITGRRLPGNQQYAEYE